MRTTLTLDPDVVRLIEQQMRRDHTSMKQTVNEALRRGLTAPAKSKKPRYRVKPHATTLRPGVDVQGFNRLADQLEDDAIVDALKDGR